MSLKWLTLLNVHYKAALTEQEIEIYLEPLSKYGAKQLDDAFQLCREECIFMPRVADIVQRIAPEKRYYEGEPSPYDRSEDKALSRKLFAEFWEEHQKRDPEPMPGQRWSENVYAIDRAQNVLPERSWGWRPREESWRLDVEFGVRAAVPNRWHEPIKGPNIRQ